MKITKPFKKMLMNNEEVLAVTQKHKSWILGWWMNPFNLILVALIIGIFIFLYKLHIKRNDVLILTNKRIIGSINPGLFVKDKIELMVAKLDNIEIDETFIGNVFGWTHIKLQTQAGVFEQRMITKKSMKEFKSQYYEL